MTEQILDNLKIGIAILDKNFRLKYLNRQLKNLIIIDTSDFEKIQERFGNAFNCKNIGMDITCGTGQSCQSCDVAPLFTNVYNGEEGVIFDIEVLADRFKINQKGKFELKGYPLYIGDEKFIQLEVHEVTEKKMLEKNLQIKEKIEKKLHLFLDAVDDIIFYIDKDGKFEYCNNSYLKFLGKTLEEVIGKTEQELVPQNMAQKCHENNIHTLNLGTFFQEEYFNGHWYQTFKGRIELDDGNTGILGVVRDITLQKNRESELSEKAYLDMLTGLFNRNFFEEKISKNMVAKEVTAILIDLDNFKIINDTLGHYVGDYVLKSISNIVKINVRKEDYAVRMGGDEFLILTHSDLKGAENIAERILNSAREIKIQGGSVSLSIGIGENRKEGAILSKVIKNADDALYSSKNYGKNKISFKS